MGGAAEQRRAADADATTPGGQWDSHATRNKRRRHADGQQHATTNDDTRRGGRRSGEAAHACTQSTWLIARAEFQNALISTPRTIRRPSPSAVQCDIIYIRVRSV